MASAVVVVIGMVLAIKLFLTANKIIVPDEGAAALNDEVDPSLLNGEGDGRVNTLLIGVGGEGHVAGDLSDSIMIVSVDPFSKDTTMLSIPRDMYVSIGNFGSAKINAAHAYGEQYDYPGGGPALLTQTLEKTLGVPIHYFVRLDFEGFKQAVDTVGGVDVYVKETIRDYSYPNRTFSGFEPFIINAGQHHLNGEIALKFARSRYTTSDFDRAARQQQIISAFKDKALSVETAINPFRINKLLSSIGNHVLTNLRVDEMLKLINISKEVGVQQIVRAVLDNSPDNYLASSQINGQSALIPRAGNYSEIKRFVRSIMIDGYIKREGAKVRLLNGTTNKGMAEKVARLLKSYGYQLVEVGNAPSSDYASTEIYNHSGGSNRYTLHYLQKRFGANPQQRDFDALNPADITIIIGSDYILTE